MDTYLLLRSNKQSGPYSLQQLVSSGLKPYDLVWVEGKSAAWRYPSEVDLLKDYAPATEEQPYDRFYKKPEEKPVSMPVQKEERLPEPAYVLTNESNTLTSIKDHNTVTPTKKVFVSMPENHVAAKPSAPVPVKAPIVNEVRPVALEEREVESKPVFVKEEPVLKEKPVLPEAQLISYEKSVPLNGEPALNEKYSESLDDIKRRYTETYLSRKKKSKWTSTHTSLVQVFGGAIFFCVLVVVVYKNFSGEEKSLAKTTIIQPDKRSINTSTLTNTPVIIPPVTTETNKQPGKKIQTVKEELNPPDESLVINSALKKNDEIINESETAAAEKKAVMTKSTEEAKSEEVKTKPRPINIGRLVNVKANDYKQRAFGGVMNLQLTVNNDSKFELDKVIVELQYLKPSEQPIKTERIVFGSIGANDSKTLKIPDFLRGVKVAYKITSIESSQYETQTAGL
jgi:hypothetical protein